MKTKSFIEVSGRSLLLFLTLSGCNLAPVTAVPTRAPIVSGVVDGVNFSFFKTAPNCIESKPPRITTFCRDSKLKPVRIQGMVNWGNVGADQTERILPRGTVEVKSYGSDVHVKFRGNSITGTACQIPVEAKINKGEISIHGPNGKTSWLQTGEILSNSDTRLIVTAIINDLCSQP